MHDLPIFCSRGARLLPIRTQYFNRVEDPQSMGGIVRRRSC